MKLVLIPPGEFILGNAYDGSPDEWPQTRVDSVKVYKHRKSRATLASRLNMEDIRL